MKVEFAGFDWDRWNRDKCTKHGVSHFAIEALFQGRVFISPAPEPSFNEQRYIAIGETALGRKVMVVFAFRHKANGILLRPISARFMHAKEVIKYEKLKEKSSGSKDR